MAKLNQANEEAKKLNQEMQFILDAVVSIGDKLTSSFRDAVDEAVELGDVTETLGNTLKKGYSKDLRDITKISEELIKAQARQGKGLLKNSEIEKLKIKLLEAQALREARITMAKDNGVALSEEQLVALDEQIKKQQEVLDSIEAENKKRGITGSILDKVKQKLADIRPADIASAVFTYMVKMLKEVDKEVVEIQRSFAVTKGEALEINQTFARTALEANTLGVNLETVTKATNTLNEALGGTANVFTKEIRNEAAFLQERLGLSNEALGEIFKTSQATGKSLEQITDEQEASFKAVKATTGVSLDFRKVLNEANQIGGALRLNMDALPGGIVEAVAMAKSLGLELETIKGIQSSILDFENSIAAELEAEVLTGKELNLERARTAALNNDIAGLTQEIATQFGSVAEFQKLNYIQQEAFANAVGMSSDQLANTLKTQESINSTLETGVETQGESLTANAAALSAQEALTQSIGQLNTILKTSLALIMGIAAAALVVMTGGAALPAVLAGVAGAGAGFGIQSVLDGEAPSERGPFTITDSYGATAVTAKGDGVVVSPNISQGGGEGITRAQANEMISLLKQVAAKDFSINMDSRKLSNAIQTSGVSYNS